jgi:hypothetical protein
MVEIFSSNDYCTVTSCTTEYGIVCNKVLNFDNGNSGVKIGKTDAKEILFCPFSIEFLEF